MALTLINSPGLGTSNAYCSLSSCLPILEQNIHIYSTFASLTTANAEACLIMATFLLDTQIQWVGTKSEESQALRWPRDGAESVDGESIDEDTIPIFLQKATSYYAYFLSQTDRVEDSDTYGFKSLKAGSLAMVIDKYDRKPVMPSIVWEIVRPYGTRIAGIPRVLERR